jgi:phage shock protein A
MKSRSPSDRAPKRHFAPDTREEGFMGFFGKLWAVIRGIFIRSGDSLVSSSPEAIRATYAAAIDDAKKRYKEMEKAVALLANERSKTEMAIEDLKKEEADLQRRLEGALALAEAEPENNAHREAGQRYLARIEEIHQRRLALSNDLEAQRVKVEDFKTKLRSFTDEINKLKREQGEMVADFVSAQQVVSLEDRLKGISESAVDESLVAIRERVGQMKSQARIATEMRQSSLGEQDKAYEIAGAQREAASRFDELLKARQAAKVGQSEKERDLG